jgi:hypothetical protein
MAPSTKDNRTVVARVKQLLVGNPVAMRPLINKFDLLLQPEPSSTPLTKFYFAHYDQM